MQAIGVIDRVDHLLVSVPVCALGQSDSATGQTSCSDPGAQQVATSVSSAPVHAALRGDMRPAQWLVSQGTTTLVAVPVIDVHGDRVGVLVLVLAGATQTASTTATALTFTGQFVYLLWKGLEELGFSLILAASAIGTVTGLWIARTIARRLRRIAEVASAWSRGEFAATIREPGRDEISQLAQDLNGMAIQIQALLTVREQLAVVEERNRLARDLHDVVKQHLFSTALLVNAARQQMGYAPEQAMVHLQEAEDLAQLAQEEVGTLIKALRPAALEDRGLAAVLRTYATDWAQRSGITLDMRILGEQATPVVVEEALLRIIQEALANVARHSGATRAQVTLSWREKELCVEIADNGRGFPTRQGEQGLGLQSMRERAERVQGTMMVESSPAGITIRVTVPVTASVDTALRSTKQHGTGCNE